MAVDGAVGGGRVSYYDRQPSQYENWEATGISGGGGRDAGGYHGQNRGEFTLQYMCKNTCII